MPPALLLLPRAWRLGPVSISTYGLCAAAGLLLAMGCVRRAARQLGTDPEAAWDAGLFAILSCFIASRLLLVLHDPVAFAHYPLLVLGLPSLTFGGLAVAAAMVVAYLRHKHLDGLLLLDLYAVPAALLAALLELGHALDGSEAGMPSALPWAVHNLAFSDSLRFHPVAWYGVIASLSLAGLLWGLLTSRQSKGDVAAWGLIAGGAAAFLLDTLTQPLPATVDLWLEPGQWIALAAMLGGAVLLILPPRHRNAAASVNPAPDAETMHMHTEVH